MAFLTIINRTFNHDLLRYANNEAHTDNRIAFASIVPSKCCSSVTGLLGGFNRTLLKWLAELYLISFVEWFIAKAPED